MILILVNTLDMKKKLKRKNKILLKGLSSIDDINICEYIRPEYERIVRKDIKNNSNNHLRLQKKLFGQYFGDLEVPDQIYLTINVVEIFKFL